MLQYLLGIVAKVRSKFFDIFSQTLLVLLIKFSDSNLFTQLMGLDTAPHIYNAAVHSCADEPGLVMLSLFQTQAQEYYYTARHVFAEEVLRCAPDYQHRLFILELLHMYASPVTY